MCIHTVPLNVNGLEHARKMYLVEKAIVQLINYEEKVDPMIKYKQLCGEAVLLQEQEELLMQQQTKEGKGIFSYLDGGSTEGGSLSRASESMNDDASSQFSIDTHQNNNQYGNGNKQGNNNSHKSSTINHHQNIYSNYNSNIYSIVSNDNINVYNNEVLAIACGAHIHWHISHVNDRYRKERAEGYEVGIGGGAEGAGIPTEYHQYYRLLEMGLPHKVYIHIYI